MSNHNLLIKYWIVNFLNDKINDEILLLIFLEAYDKNTVENELLKNKELVLKNYMILDIKEVNSINEINKNTNIILLAHPLMVIDKFIDCNYVLIFSSLNQLKIILSKDDIKSELNAVVKPNIHPLERYLYYIEKRDLIKIIKYDENDIRNQIYSLFNETTNIAGLKLFDTYIFHYKRYSRHYFELYNHISEELSFLAIHGILTSNLAIIIYKSATLKFDDSDTKIGLYYKKMLGIKSKLIHLPSSKPYKSVKAYDLKKIRLE